MNEVPRFGNVQWKGNKLVAVQIRDILLRVGDSETWKTTIWGYFKNFQNEMKVREIIPTIMEKYKDTIFLW